MLSFTGMFRLETSCFIKVYITKCSTTANSGNPLIACFRNSQLESKPISDDLYLQNPFLQLTNIMEGNLKKLAVCENLTNI